MLRQNNLDDERFAGLAEQARSRVANIFPAWTDMNTHDPGIMLIELFAWLTEAQRFHMDQSEDAAVFFPLLGIVPHQVRPARVRIVLNERVSVTVPAGVQLAAKEVCFETETPIHAGSEAGTSLYAVQKRTVRMRCGSANGFPGQSFTVETNGQRILHEGFSLMVAPDGELSCAEHWELTDSFRASGPDDPHFILDGDTIIFGDGIRGRMPKGLVFIEEMSLTRGADGNITSGQLTELNWNGCCISISQPEPAEGGAERENTSETMTRLVAEKRQAVTAEDIQRLVMETPDFQPEAALAFAPVTTPEPGMPRVITVAVKPFGERAELTPEQKRAVRIHLEPYRLAGYDFNVCSAVYIPVKLSVEVGSRRHAARLIQRVETSLHEFFCKTYGGFSTRIKRAALAEFISGIPEVLLVQSCELRTYSPRARIDARGDILPDPGTVAYLESIKIKTL